MEDFELNNTLPPGTITFEEAAWQSTIDMCMVTMGLVDRVIRSEIEREPDHDSDHLPISTELDLTVQRLENTSRKNYKRLNEKAYTKALKQALPPLRRPATKAALDAYVQEIVAAVKEVIDKAVPQARLTPQ